MHSDHTPAWKIVGACWILGLLLVTTFNVIECRERIRAIETADTAYHEGIARELTEVRRMLDSPTPERTDHAAH
jgi:hypothetical protein